MLFLKVRIGELFREREVRRLFYSNKAFAKIDRALKRLYRFRNSYAISRRFHGTHCYGETPLPVYDRIAKKCGLSRDDHLLELGSGRGRGALFLQQFYGCYVSAIEVVPVFTQLLKELACPRVQPIEEDFLSCDLSEATCIYLYGSSLSNEQIKKLCKRLANSRAKIVTVSYPLKAYDASFTVLEKWTEKFPWGETELYLQKKVDNIDLTSN